MIQAGFWEQFRDAMWDGRWLALESFWIAGVQHPWIFAVFGAAIVLRGRRAWIAVVRWIGATVWHHARN